MTPTDELSDEDDDFIDDDISDEDDDFIDDDDFIEENIYDTDDLPLTRFSIALCELYNNKIHGPTSNPLINSGFLLLCRFKTLHIKAIRLYIQNLLHNLRVIPSHLFKNHTVIRNYPFLYLHIKPEIAECHYLDTGEIMCVKKTIWIKLIQRTWKNIYKKRQQVLKRRYSIHSLKHKEINGNWPPHCANLPNIHGMLHYLVN